MNVVHQKISKALEPHVGAAEANESAAQILAMVQSIVTTHSDPSINKYRYTGQNNPRKPTYRFTAKNATYEVGAGLDGYGGFLGEHTPGSQDKFQYMNRVKVEQDGVLIEVRLEKHKTNESRGHGNPHCHVFVNGTKEAEFDYTLTDLGCPPEIAEKIERGATFGELHSGARVVFDKPSDDL